MSAGKRPFSELNYVSDDSDYDFLYGGREAEEPVAGSSSDPLGLAVPATDLNIWDDPSEEDVEQADETPVYTPRVTVPVKGVVYIHPKHGKSKFLGKSWACPHGRRRIQCKECGGSSICPHNRQRSQCKECGGSNICEHGKIRNNCTKCYTSEQMLASGTYCFICYCTRLHPLRMLKKGGSGICAGCDPGGKKKLEHCVRDALLPMIAQSPEAVEYVRFGTDCDYQDKAFRMPDLLWTVYSTTGQLAGTIKVGIDEDSHSTYTAICEGGKVSNQHEALNELAFRMDKELAKGTKSKLTHALLANHIETRKEAKLATDMGGRRLLPQFYLKVNFDSYDGPRTTWNTRLETLAHRVNSLLAHLRDGAPGTDTTRPNVEFYWYHSKADFIVQHFQASAAAVNTRVYPTLA